MVVSLNSRLESDKEEEEEPAQAAPQQARAAAPRAGPPREALEPLGSGRLEPFPLERLESLERLGPLWSSWRASRTALRARAGFSPPAAHTFQG